MCRIVIGSVDVWWILYFTLHSYIYHWLRYALLRLLVVTSHIMMRVLEHDTHV